MVVVGMITPCSPYVCTLLFVVALLVVVGPSSVPSLLLALVPQMSFETPSLALSCFLSIQPLLLNPPHVSPLGTVLVSR